MYCFSLIGLKKEFFPSDAQKAVLIKFIQDRLGNYTPEEIKLAFELAIVGKFDIDLDHYGEGFSPKYLMRIFGAFTNHRNKIALELDREQKRLELVESPEDEAKKVEDFLKSSIEIYKNSKLTFSGTKYHANIIYDLLKVHFTREELIDFKEETRLEIVDLKKDFDERIKYGQSLTTELAKTSFTKTGWRQRTALKTANEALKRGIII